MSFPEKPYNIEGAPKKEVVLIVGMHRSGTSALAKLLKRVGFYFGENLLKKIEGVNPGGFWEDATAVAINEELLTQLGSNWYGFLSLPPNWSNESRVSGYYEKLERWFNEQFNNDLPVCIKDPRFCRTLPLWLDFFHKKGLKPKIIFIYRNPYSVASSLYQRDGIDVEVCHLLWLSYTIDALEHIKNEHASLVCYENLIRRPADVLTVLMASIFKDIYNIKRHRITRDANAAINPENNHYPNPGSLKDAHSSKYSELAEELYHELQKAAPDQLGLMAEDYRQKFNKLCSGEKVSIDTLQRTTNAFIATNKKLSEVGEAHTLAINTIIKKDRIYEVSLAGAEKRIAGNKTYIKKCHTRIREQDELLKALGKKAELVEHLEKCVKDREQKIAENTDYIKRCEARIRQQDEVIYGLKKTSVIWQLYYAIKLALQRLKGRVAE